MRWLAPGQTVTRRGLAAVAAWLMACGGVNAESGRYLGIDEFLASVFASVPSEPDALVVDSELRERIESVLGHRFPGLRLRYWDDGATTAWILDEIGKTEPITIGVAIRDGRVASVRVLEFRESRGWEVRYPFFTEQFTGARIEADDAIDREIDGITGATLSVVAVEKTVRAALVLDERVRKSQPASSS
jgi:uncharacterized protein with FMN-binding domain